MTSPKDKQIIEEVQGIKDYHTVKTMPKADAQAKGLYRVIGREIDDKYMAELKKQIIHPDVIAEVADDLKIVYTPLCGTGNVPVRRILSELGFKHVYVVPEQENPDPKFTTLDYPNPEDPKAFTYALRLAKEKDADIVLATDPDADRLGVYAKDSATGEYVSLTEFVRHADCGVHLKGEDRHGHHAGESRPGDHHRHHQYDPPHHGGLQCKAHRGAHGL